MPVNFANAWNSIEAASYDPDENLAMLVTFQLTTLSGHPQQLLGQEGMKKAAKMYPLAALLKELF